MGGKKCSKSPAAAPPNVAMEEQKAPGDKASPGADPNGGGLPSGHRPYLVKLMIADSPALTVTLRVSSIGRPPSSQRASIV